MFCEVKLKYYDLWPPTWSKEKNKTIMSTNHRHFFSFAIKGCFSFFFPCDERWGGVPFKHVNPRPSRNVFSARRRNVKHQFFSHIIYEARICEVSEKRQTETTCCWLSEIPNHSLPAAVADLMRLRYESMHDSDHFTPLSVHCMPIWSLTRHTTKFAVSEEASKEPNEASTKCVNVIPLKRKYFSGLDELL